MNHRTVVARWVRGVFVVLCALLPLWADADVLDDLRQQLLERRQKLQEIEGRIERYRQEVAERQEVADTLRGQVRVIEGQVSALTLELDKTAVEVEKTETEERVVGEEIRRAEGEMDKKRRQLREAIRLLQVVETDSVVETFFKYPSLSGALTEIRAVERVQQRTQETLGEVKQLREALGTKAASLRDLERELKELKDRQEKQRRTLEDQEAAKERLYEITKSQEAEFQELLQEAAAERRRANAEIARIEAEVRAELARQGITSLGGVGIFDWPVDPIFGISCGFHCPDYPYRHLIGPHAGIDLPTHMGTPVRAGADGYVARTYDSGGPGYSYILILHGDNFSTVYGHLSSIAISEGKFVTRGQAIGATGGAPGTRGAGLSTGPHLHFEVRKDGVPVNPAQYLP
ncbi:MAG: peptidase M23 [Parcubacteria group bacterium Gr01-1014_38]|nr:MAG: peptidase M23 [Parcubacteria group bacterium Gr01-1014_38]